MRFLAALLAASLPLAGLGEAQLLPTGAFAARDGRPGVDKKWVVTDAQGEKLAADMNATAARTPIVIDYDHQTLYADKSGQIAPAAGWIKAVEWRPGKGLFATVEWTARAKALIDSKEYQYISPVITYDDAGTVTGVLLAALVNHPALTGMEAAVAQLATNLSFLNQEPDVSLLASLLATLGLPNTTTEADALAAVTALKATVNVKPAVPAALSAALGLTGTPTEKDAVDAVAALKTAAPDGGALALIKDLQAQVTKLSTDHNSREVEQLVDGAIAAHRFAPAHRPFLVAQGMRSLAELKSLIEASPVIPGLGGQSGGGSGGGEGGSSTGALSATQASICTQLGLNPKDFAEALKAKA